MTITQNEPGVVVSESEKVVSLPEPKHILVAVDHTETAAWAMKLAESLARRFAADLRLVHVLDQETQAGETGELIREGEQFVADYPAAAPADGTRLDRVFRIGRPAEEIVAAATEWSADLIVVGTHGRRGIDRLLLGSTAEGVLRRASCPVLCVGHEPTDPVRIGRILVAVDDSDQAAWAADIAASWRRSLAADAALLHVAPFAAPVEPGYALVVDRADEALRATGQAFLDHFPWPEGQPPLERLLKQGPAADEIVAAGREWHADLIAMGTHGRRGLRRLLLGSTAEAVLRHSPCPVLCVSQGPRSA